MGWFWAIEVTAQVPATWQPRLQETRQNFDEDPQSGWDWRAAPAVPPEQDVSHAMGRTKAARAISRRFMALGARVDAAASADAKSDPGPRQPGERGITEAEHLGQIR